MLLKYKKSNQYTEKATEAIYLGSADMEFDIKKQGGRRLNVNGVLRQLDVSSNVYNNLKNRIPSNLEQQKNIIKNKICDICDESQQNYVTPKIAKKLKEGSIAPVPELVQLQAQIKDMQMEIDILKETINVFKKPASIRQF